MDTRKSLAPALTNYFMACQPWAMIPDTVQALMNQAVNVDFVQALSSRAGQPLNKSPNIEMRGETAIIRVVGPLFRYSNLITQYFHLQTTEQSARDFAAVQGEEQVKRIVMVYDSPGGQASGISEFAEMIKKSSKPVTAYIDGMAASAAYWLASAASRIIVSKTAELGSIGAVLGIDTRGQDGIVRIVSSQSPLKQANPETEEGRSELQQRIDALAQIFIEDVAENRRVSVDTVLSDFGRGGIKIGEQAVAAGMADEIGSFEGLLAG